MDRTRPCYEPQKPSKIRPKPGSNQNSNSPKTDPQKPKPEPQKKPIISNLTPDPGKSVRLNRRPSAECRWGAWGPGGGGGAGLEGRRREAAPPAPPHRRRRAASPLSNIWLRGADLGRMCQTGFMGSVPVSVARNRGAWSSDWSVNVDGGLSIDCGDGFSNRYSDFFCRVNLFF